ncbi:MAG: hypothetical protein ACKVVT_04100 [Dehalococcoidia bacterium]
MTVSIDLRPLRCPNCEFLFYPDSRDSTLCELCKQSLDDYVRSMTGASNPTIGWWDRQRDLRSARKVRPL